MPNERITVEQARAAVPQGAGNGLAILPGTVENLARVLTPQLPTVLLTPVTRANAAILRRRYPQDCEARLLEPAEAVSGGAGRTAPLDDALLLLERADTGIAALALPALSWEQDDQDFRTLADVVARLRAPGGCPWDREQTHQSLTPFLIEETYEVIEQIDADSMPGLQEELGDILLQVALHSAIAAEEGQFSVNDVIRGLVRKLVRRHPHVFGDAQARTAEEVAARWEVLKSAERQGASLMEGVPASLPALTYAQRTQGRAANVGFDWPNIDGVLAKVAEEAAELAAAGASSNGGDAADARTAQEWELGDLLFSLVNLARRLEIDAEGALRHANRRFVMRFRHMETLARNREQTLEAMPLDSMDALWEEAKSIEGKV